VCTPSTGCIMRNSFIRPRRRFRLEFCLCGPLVKCLAEIGAGSLSAVTRFVDAEALVELAETADASTPYGRYREALESPDDPTCNLSVEVEA